MGRSNQPCRDGKKNFLGCLLKMEWAPESGSVSHLSPYEWLGLWKSSVLRKPPEPSLSEASVPSPATPARPTTAHREPASPWGAGAEGTGSLSGPLPPGLSGLVQGGEGSCGPGDGDSPPAAGACGHPAARGAEGGEDDGFPSPQRVTSPIPPPSLTSSINRLSRLTWPGGKGERHRARETYILCGHR